MAKSKAPQPLLIPKPDVTVLDTTGAPIKLAKSKPPQTLLTLHVSALSTSFTVPRESLQNARSSYFASLFSFNDASGKTTDNLTIRPPAPMHFPECLVYAMTGYEQVLNSAPEVCMGIYRNADFMAMDDLVRKCLLRFVALAADLETLTNFTHDHISREHLKIIVDDMKDDKDKLKTMLVWSRGSKSDLQSEMEALICPGPDWAPSASLTPSALQQLVNAFPHSKHVVPLQVVMAVMSGKESRKRKASEDLVSAEEMLLKKKGRRSQPARVIG